MLLFDFRQWPLARDNFQNNTIKHCPRLLFSHCMLLDRKVRRVLDFQYQKLVFLYTNIQLALQYCMHGSQWQHFSWCSLFLNCSLKSLPSLFTPDYHSWQAHSRDQYQSFSSTAPSRDQSTLSSTEVWFHSMDLGIQEHYGLWETLRLLSVFYIFFPLLVLV